MPFDVPDDLPWDAIYEVAPTDPNVKFVCDQPITTQGFVSKAAGWRETEYPPCTAPAHWRATATRSSKLHFPPAWLRGGRVVDFEDGEHRNVCGTHKGVLEREGWSIEELPE